MDLIDNEERLRKREIEEGGEGMNGRMRIA